MRYRHLLAPGAGAAMFAAILFYAGWSACLWAAIGGIGTVLSFYLILHLRDPDISDGYS
jgi:hypothetical protein